MLYINLSILIVYSLFFVSYRRKIDFFLVAFVSASIYFCPIFIGIIVAPPGYMAVKPVIEVSVIYHFIVIFLLLFSLAFDQKNIKRNHWAMYKKNLYKFKDNYKYYPVFMLFLSFFLLDRSLLEVSSKRELVGNTDIRIIIFLVLLYYSSFLLFLSKSYLWKAGSLVIIGFTMYLGFRSYAAIFLITVILIHQDVRKIKLNFNKLVVLSVLSPILLIGLVLSKRTYAHIKANGFFQGVSDVFYGNVDYSDSINAGSEFLGTQYILQAVIEEGSNFDVVNFLNSFVGLQPIPTSFFGINSSAFNDFFQASFFPGVNYGMGYNPWAEIYTYFGMLGLFFFAMFYAAFIYSIQVLLYKIKYTNVLFLPILPIGVLWAFYIHRNSLAVEFAFFRNFFYTHFLLFYVYKAFRSIFSQSFFKG